MKILLSLMLAGLSLVARADVVDDYLQAQMARNHIPGMAVAVVRAGRIEKLQTYGMANLEWQQAVTPDTAFQLASTTKPLTGLLVMRLVQAGKLDLQASVRRYLPQLPEAWQAVTIRHLADHSSGVPDHLQAASVQAYTEAAVKKGLDHAPGARADYGIGGYMVLRQIIEQVTGKDFAVALREWVLAPLDMQDSAFDGALVEDGMLRSRQVRRRATVYEWDGADQANFVFPFGRTGIAAGGLFSSIRDLSKMAQALDGDAFLPAALKQAMWTPAQLGDGRNNSFAVGWALARLDGRPTVGHSGGPALSDFLHLPQERLSVIVLTNAQKMYPYLAQGVARRLLPPATVERKALPDTRPEVTARVRQIIEKGMRGEVQEDAFAADARKNFVPPMRNFLFPLLQALDPIEEFMLIEERPNGPNLTRLYAARHGKDWITWDFGIDPDGHVLGFGPR
ncbi:serine hydrolase [Massilia sp. TS11]|uniref:serine hydrolase domain-containing protein n=1 Tax=Massilia sp. TS11 TaxID=2908003 RepID=UPI001EDC0A79|nr:serine hydrolase domain-containing protein [Massilia sp. TS11]MCG2586803.1 beta-lactamase family protein [Massilia sp. TS11]